MELGAKEQPNGVYLQLEKYWKKKAQRCNADKHHTAEQILKELRLQAPHPFGLDIKMFSFVSESYLFIINTSQHIQMDCIIVKYTDIYSKIGTLVTKSAWSRM